jgi:hypothetical protein
VDEPLRHSTLETALGLVALEARVEVVMPMLDFHSGRRARENPLGSLPCMSGAETEAYSAVQLG